MLVKKNSKHHPKIKMEDKKNTDTHKKSKHNTTKGSHS